MELRFDFATDDKKTGFRLDSFEFYNWGTYNNRIISLDLNQTNALLTGDIGSGKSTIVDAIMTLLVPSQKIIYNKAAGAKSKERTIRSYILGEYKSSKDENYTSSKAVSLRDEDSFSVLLANFKNHGFDESVSLAGFFYISNSKEHRFFVVSQNKLDIKKDFFNFDSDIKKLKKRLRARPHTRVYDGFMDYSKDFSRLMGIKNAQALNLFYQTVSLKEIGNLTTFIRVHMLESSGIDKMVEELCKNFADLSHAHKSVLLAKEEIELLIPIDKESKRYKNIAKDKFKYENIREVLRIYFARIEIELVRKKIGELEIELKKLDSNQTNIQEELEELRADEVNIKLEIQKNGGNRINEIEKEIKNHEIGLKDKKSKNQKYNELAKSIGFPVTSNEHRFLNNMQNAKKMLELVEQDLSKIENKKIRNGMSKKQYEDKSKSIKEDILYLQNRRSNIPHQISKIRDEIAKELNINPEELPFAGELIKATDKEWEGAIQRILNSFALSLLVEDKYYKDVAWYIEKTNLKGKLIYLKIFKKSKRVAFGEVLDNSLLKKIEIKADTKLFEPLNEMLNDRFNVPCVNNMEDFRRFKKALTIHGQFKTNFTRHEKDDRYELNDKKRWVLGWENLEKLKSFEKEYESLKEKITYLDVSLEQIKKDKDILQKQRDNLLYLSRFEDFSEIDWYNISKKIDKLSSEIEILKKSSDIIKTLNEKLEITKSQLKDKSIKARKIDENRGGIQSILKTQCKRKVDLKEILTQVEKLTQFIQILDEIFFKYIKNPINLTNISKEQSNLRGIIQAKINSLEKQLSRSQMKIINMMSSFVNKFPVIAKDFDANIESMDDFSARLFKLKKDDLPRWERRFNELLKEGTIRNIMIIQEELNQQSKDIKEKIQKINDSLRDIEYNDGTYVELIAEQGVDAEIREFKQALKSATQGSIQSDNSYDEQKFIEIKEIIDRFNGRVKYVDIDKKWTKKVTDVRNWFNFAATERYASDGSEKEYYAHSGGKSGGQKEKLAYTVLASSLAYQFGVEHDKIQSRSFRFVMIDEAFGRGSDESTRYALSLFEKLKLQLLVITPKQKINVIEPFVKSVHFVANPDGMSSSLLSMSIQEYQKNKK